MSYSIVFIGAGNLATHLSSALQKSGNEIIQVYSRTESSAKKLGLKLSAGYTTDPAKILKGADIYIIALKDNVYDKVLPFADFGNNLVVHCSGSMPQSVLSDFSINYGVLYPLQTFSKGRVPDFRTIPVYVEGNTIENEIKLKSIARQISDKVFVADSPKRLYLHIAAVFACNFVNYFYSVAADILSEKDIPFDVLKPLIRETALKAEEINPVRAQTGPAVRFDLNVISKHLESLNDFPDYKALYNIISNGIYKLHNKPENSPSGQILENVKAFIFDVDGVLSEDTSTLNNEGDPARTANVKDGFAIRSALNAGYHVAVITGANIPGVRKRYEKIGVEHFYDNVDNKEACLSGFMETTGLKYENILYMGDDLVDYKVMKKVGIPACPFDAAEEIKSVSRYISPFSGGRGCVRDVIEKTLQVQKRWFEDINENKAF
ncbi:MAG: DUF2520 domain-containing protein [Prolixibacteraceae bacterium]|nr:DUF2520 domain-containing protein [Prolixibacteraceae bacterium]